LCKLPGGSSFLGTEQLHIYSIKKEEGEWEKARIACPYYDYQPPGKLRQTNPIDIFFFIW
jgi:hypothetical protein